MRLAQLHRAERDGPQQGDRGERLVPREQGDAESEREELGDRAGGRGDVPSRAPRRELLDGGGNGKRDADGKRTGRDVRPRGAGLVDDPDDGQDRDRQDDPYTEVERRECALGLGHRAAAAPYGRSRSGPSRL